MTIVGYLLIALGLVWGVRMWVEARERERVHRELKRMRSYQESLSRKLTRLWKGRD